MKKTLSPILLIAFLTFACKEQNKEKKADTQTEAAPKLERIQEETPKISKTEENTPKSKLDDLETEIPYVSENFYGNGINEFLHWEKGKCFYSSTKNPKKIELKIFDVKDNIVDEVALVTTGKMQFPNDTKVYSFAIYESEIVITHPNGKTQEYKTQADISREEYD